jgi:hypothetical protein
MSPGCLPIIRVNQSEHWLDVAASTGSVPSGVGGLLLDYPALELGIIIDPVLLRQYDLISVAGRP